MRAILWAGAMALVAYGAVAAPMCKNWGEVPPAGPDHLTSYVFAIDPQDRVNSRGAALASPLAIVQQDRANMHKFGRPGGLDQRDGLFATLDWRQLITTAELRGACDLPLADLELVMMDATYMQIYQVDVFVEADRLVIFVGIVAG